MDKDKIENCLRFLYDVINEGWIDGEFKIDGNLIDLGYIYEAKCQLDNISRVRNYY